MAKFGPNEFVSIHDGRRTVIGRIVRREGSSYRVFTADRRELTRHSRSLRHASRAALILESNLSKGRSALRTDLQRRGGVFLEEMFRSLGVTVYREKVHTVEDLVFFMKQARVHNIQFVHYCGHGYDDGETAGLKLSAGTVRLPATNQTALEKKLQMDGLGAAERRRLDGDLQHYADLQRAFSEANLRGKVLVFSACELGRKGGLAEYVSRISKAKAVIAYDKAVYDGQTNTAEALLYWQLVHLETKARPPTYFVKQLRATSRAIMGFTLPIACYVAGVRQA